MGEARKKLKMVGREENPLTVRQDSSVLGSMLKDSPRTSSGSGGEKEFFPRVFLGWRGAQFLLFLFLQPGFLGLGESKFLQVWW